jgi:hypothetical protein
MNKSVQPGYMKLLALVATTTLLVACGGGSGGGSDGGGSISSGEVAAQDLAASETVITSEVGGSVGDGPITGATVRIYGKSGKLIDTVSSDNTATYKSTIKAKGKKYPLVLRVDDGTDLVTGGAPDFELISVMMRPSSKQVNINPYSTLVVMIAEAMPGGLKAENVTAATTYVMDKLGFGLDPKLFSSPITVPINESNIANMVKSSEALGEMVRRTRDQMTAAGTVISGDEVMQAIAADMTDGYLDGLGSTGTNAMVAAVANVVSGQVLVEALSNTLRVGGVIATDVIDQSIEITRSQIRSSQLTGNVRITPGMLKQTRVALSAVQVIDSSAQVSEMASTVETINGDSLPEEIALVLPADSSVILDNAVVLSSIASEEEANAINEAVRATDGTVDPAPEPTPEPTPALTGSFDVRWTAPATRADGEPLSLTDINGYRIYYGDTSGNYTDVAEVPDGTATSATVTDVPVGTSYLVMTTYDVDGRESGYSREISKPVQ